MSADLQAIREQIEFYFSEANIPNDKFIQTTFKANENKFPVKVLMTFKRLTNLTTDVDVVSQALQSSQVVKLDANKEYLTLVDEDQLESLLSGQSTPTAKDKLSIYMTGFGKDISIDKVQKLLKSKKVNFAAIRLQKVVKKDGSVVYTGECFVELKNEDDVSTVAAYDFNEDGSENKICVMSKEEFMMTKEKNRAAQEAEKQKKIQIELNKQQLQHAQLERFKPTPQFVKDHIVAFSAVPVGSFREQFRDLLWKLLEKETGETITKETVKESGVDPLADTKYDLEWICYSRDAPAGCYKFKSNANTAEIVKLLNANVKLQFTEGPVPEFAIMPEDEAKAQWDIIESEKEMMASKGAQSNDRNNKKRKGNFKSFKNKKGNRSGRRD